MSDTNEQVVTAPTSLAEAAFGTVAPTEEAPKQTTPEAVVPPLEKKDEAATPPVEESDLKKHLGYDDWEVAKNEIAEFRKLKESPASTAPEIKYENPESEKLHKAIAAGKTKEVLEILARQEQLAELTSSEINKDVAAKVVKAAMKLKYGLDDNQVEYRFAKQFGVSPKPQREADELDDEYSARVQQWEQKVQDAEMELMIEAKIVRPDLEQHKVKLVLPDIQQAQPTVKEPSEEDKAAFKKQQEAFMQSVEETMKSFTGFSTAVKDKDVDLSLSYGLSDDEKKEVSAMVKQFAETGFDANSIFAGLWVKDGKIDTTKMVSDLSRLLAGDKVSQALATEAANKRLEAYLKEKKKINIGETDTRGQFVPAPKEELDKVREAAFSS